MSILRLAALSAVAAVASVLSACDSGGTEPVCDASVNAYAFINYDTVQVPENAFALGWLTAMQGDSLDITASVSGPSTQKRYVFDYVGQDTGFVTIEAWRDSSTRARFDIEVIPAAAGCNGRRTYVHHVVWTGMSGHGGLQEVVVTPEE